MFKNQLQNSKKKRKKRKEGEKRNDYRGGDCRNVGGCYKKISYVFFIFFFFAEDS